MNRIVQMLSKKVGSRTYIATILDDIAELPGAVSKPRPQRHGPYARVVSETISGSGAAKGTSPMSGDNDFDDRDSKQQSKGVFMTWIIIGIVLCVIALAAALALSGSMQLIFGG